MENFTPLPAFFGGVLIGLSVVWLMLANGRIAGVSGVVGGLLVSRLRDAGWRVAFLLGLIATPLLYAAVTEGVPPVTVTSSTGLLIAGGLLVGFGGRLGSGCTSGPSRCTTRAKGRPAHGPPTGRGRRSPPSGSWRRPSSA